MRQCLKRKNEAILTLWKKYSFHFVHQVWRGKCPWQEGMEGVNVLLVTLALTADTTQSPVSHYLTKKQYAPSGKSIGFPTIPSPSLPSDYALITRMYYKFSNI